MKQVLVKGPESIPNCSRMVREIRINLSVSQFALAQALGVTSTTVLNWEHGKLPGKTSQTLILQTWLQMQEAENWGPLRFAILEAEKQSCAGAPSNASDAVEPSALEGVLRFLETIFRRQLKGDPIE